MTPTTGVDPLLLANPTQAQCHALRAGGGAAVAWAAPKPGAGASEDALLVLPVADDAAVLAVAVEASS